MREFLREILVKNSEKILTSWQEKIELILPDWQSDRLNRFVQDLMTALYIYLLDKKLQASLESFANLLSDYFTSFREGVAIIIDTLLINRYILLSFLKNQDIKNFNSIETFGYLNDLFNPLILAIYAKYHTNSRESLPEQFMPSFVAHLKSLEFAGIGFLILGQDYSIVYWSSGLVRIFDQSSDETIGRNLFHIFPEWKNISQLYKAIQNSLQTDIEEEIYAKKISISHRRHIVNFKIISISDEQNNISGCSILVHDVTELKKSENSSKKYEQYFENILNDAADAILLLNENNRIIMCNMAAEILFGYNEEQVVGKSLTLFVPKDTKSLSAIEQQNELVRSKGYVRNLIIKMINREGKILTVEITRTALRNNRNDFIGSSLIARDITQQEQLREQVFQSEKLSAVGTLAAGIAHEVGTPLTSISSLAQILQMTCQNDELKDKLSLIQQSIDHISRTVRTLVDFSRPIAQKIENIYLNLVIEQVIRILKYDKRLKKQKIFTNLDANIPLVHASFDQILQVFINICLNAADAMEDNKNGELKIKTWSDDRDVFASISDNGYGIPEQNIDHIFEPFFTTKKSKGTGLGLWVSYNIIQSFSGKIHVTSTEGTGTTFTISIPKIKKK